MAKIRGFYVSQFNIKPSYEDCQSLSCHGSGDDAKMVKNGYCTVRNAHHDAHKTKTLDKGWEMW